MDTKTMAVLKLAYLEMYGFDMSWASFHVLEVMSSSKFQQKRVGYLAAIQSFRNDPDVLMLTTNLLKKDIGSAHPLEISVALGAVASIVTPPLAQDLSDDILKMLNHSKPYVRKKAILAMYKIFLQFPEALRTSFPRLKEKLGDPDPSVVSATVNVICELAKTNPKNYVELAPALYELLTTSSDNWMLIKILKLFSSLAQKEPRLKTKLIPPILKLLDKTSSKSLMYECVNCIVSGGMLGPEDFDIAQICVEKLRPFFEIPDGFSRPDKNLKFVGLLALSKIIKVHPVFVDSHQDIILECVDDADLTIRERALDMISGVVTEDTMIEIVTRLKAQLTPDLVEKDSFIMPKSYRVSVIRKIIEICSRDMYNYLPDFDWYSSVLVELVQLADGADEVGAEIGEQLRDISVRVKEVRDTVVLASVNLASKQYCFSHMPSVLPAVLWIIGEYPSYHAYPVDVVFVITSLIANNSSWATGSGLDVKENQEALSGAVIIGIQTVVKIYAYFVNISVGWTSNRSEVINQLTDKIVSFLELFSTSLNFEVQERAVEFLELFKLIQQALEEHPKDSLEAPRLLTVAIPSLFNSYELNPVAPDSQWRIAVPEGLDLDQQIYEPELISDDESEEDWDILGGGGIASTVVVSSPEEWKSSVSNPTSKINLLLDPEESEKRKQERLERQKDDPFYISVPSGSGTPLPDSRPLTPDESHRQRLTLNENSQRSSLDIDNIPVTKLDLSQQNQQRKRRAKLAIIKDELVEGAIESDDSTNRPSHTTPPLVHHSNNNKGSALRIDSSLLANFDLNSSEANDEEGQEELEKLRKKLESKVSIGDSVSKPGDEVVAKPKKKKKSSSSKTAAGEGEKKKKKKKKAVAKIEDAPAAADA